MTILQEQNFIRIATTASKRNRGKIRMFDHNFVLIIKISFFENVSTLDGEVAEPSLSQSLWLEFLPNFCSIRTVLFSFWFMIILKEEKTISSQKPINFLL